MEWVRLAEIFEINIGKTPSRSKYEYWGKGHTWVSISDLNGKYIYDSKEEITDLAVEDTNIKIVPKNTIIMSFKLSIGKIGITKKELFTNEAIASFIPKIDIDLDYVYYALKSIDYNRYVDKAVKGKTLNKKKLNQIKMPIFDKNKQIKLSKILNKLEALISYRKKQIQAYDELIKSLFLSSIDNSKCELIKINDLILEKPKRLSKDNTSSISYFDISSIDNLKNIIKEEKIITEVNDRPGRAKQILEKNDILLSNVRPNLKNIAYFDFNNTCLAIGSTGFTILRSDIKKINPRFLFYSILTEEFTEKLLINSTGASYPAVKEEIVRDQTIKVPPIELQNKFADYVLKIEEEKEKLRSSLAELETLFNALMQDAFSGNLFKD